MTPAKIALLLAIATPCLAGGGYVVKLWGDTIWVNEDTVEERIVEVGKEEFLSSDAYQQEKLYDLQDQAADLEAKEQYEAPLTQREKEKLKRILKNVERLESQLE
jgi:hypothetical protein